MRLIVDFTFMTHKGERGDARKLMDCDESEIGQQIKAYENLRTVEVTNVKKARP